MGNPRAPRPVLGHFRCTAAAASRPRAPWPGMAQALRAPAIAVTDLICALRHLCVRMLLRACDVRPGPTSVLRSGHKLDPRRGLGRSGVRHQIPVGTGWQQCSARWQLIGSVEPQRRVPRRPSSRRQRPTGRVTNHLSL